MTDTMLTYDGITQPINDWALDYGIYPNVITDRLASGWTTERAITTPMIVAPDQKLNPEHMPSLPKPARKAPRQLLRYEFDGETLTLSEWSDRMGINRDVLRQRLRLGMEIGDALTRPVRQTGPGVVQNLGASMGTGAGCTTQDFPEIEFSQ